MISRVLPPLKARFFSIFCKICREISANSRFLSFVGLFLLNISLKYALEWLLVFCSRILELSRTNFAGKWTQWIPEKNKPCLKVVHLLHWCNRSGCSWRGRSAACGTEARKHSDDFFKRQIDWCYRESSENAGSASRDRLGSAGTSLQKKMC